VANWNAEVVVVNSCV